MFGSGWFNLIVVWCDWIMWNRCLWYMNARGLWWILMFHSSPQCVSANLQVLYLFLWWPQPQRYVSGWAHLGSNATWSRISPRKCISAILRHPTWCPILWAHYTSLPSLAASWPTHIGVGFGPSPCLHASKFWYVHLILLGSAQWVVYIAIILIEYVFILCNDNAS